MHPGDYSDTTAELRPHDLVWIAAGALSPDAPAWAIDRIRAGAPVVVRRAPRTQTTIPVGVRGASRGQRYADTISRADIARVTTPESLIDSRADRVPAMCCIAGAAPTLTAPGYRWGITGAVGFELATGLPVCHAQSDLDLIVRMPQPLSRDRAGDIHEALATLAVRCDVQLETPCGAVALADWAGAAAQCLVKGDAGPFLTADPWADAHGPVVAPCRVLTD